jgi:hypothetical protein
VARGAIIRAWDKEDGPLRISQLSFGFEITEEYDPDNEAHKGIRPTADKWDGRYYVKNTITWVIKKVFNH